MPETNRKPPETNSKPEEAEKLDEAIEGTFPASDPPSVGGSTGPNDIPSSDAPHPGATPPAAS